MLYRTLIWLLFFLPVSSFAEVRFVSPVKQTTFLELYTSEGCSSCPPADRWLSTLKEDPRLWKEIIPVAFHVDYWNYLGWKDEFSRAEYSQRQRNYARWNNLRTVYTPGFLKNGQEWRGWFRIKRLDTMPGKEVGQLMATIDNGMVKALFTPSTTMGDTVYLNIAWLGFDLETKVQAGENEGKTLKHDFVSFNTNAIKGTAKNDVYTWQFKADVASLPVADASKRRGVAFWITEGQDPTPIQATGGWLE